MSLSSSDREGNCLLTIDEFLFCYKLVEILKSAGFYQLSSGYRTFKFITSLSSSDKEWKLDFFFVYGFWASDPIKMGRGTFPPLDNA